MKEFKQFLTERKRPMKNGKKVTFYADDKGKSLTGKIESTSLEANNQRVYYVRVQGMPLFRVPEDKIES